MDVRTLCLVNNDSAFIDHTGKTVISSTQPDLVREIELASAALGGFKGRERPLQIRFDEFSEGLAVTGWALCPLCRNPFWVNGFIDETGRLVIPPKTSSTRYGKFSEGLASYSDNGWGFIDRGGRVVIAAKFHDAAIFSEGLAVVRLSEQGKFAYVNKTGEIVIPPRFLWASDFHEGLAAVKTASGVYGFIDATGRVVLQSKDWLAVNDFSEGLAAVQIETTNNRVYQGYKERRFGFIDRTGKFVISPSFDRVQRFSQGRALFRQTGENYGYGFVDATGQVLVKASFVAGKDFAEGLAAVAIKSPASSEDKSLWGYIDHEGAWVIKPQFQNAASFKGGLAAVNCDQYFRDCQAYIDRAGNYLWKK